MPAGRGTRVAGLDKRGLGWSSSPRGRPRLLIGVFSVVIPNVAEGFRVVESVIGREGSGVGPSVVVAVEVEGLFVKQGQTDGVALAGRA